MAEAQGTTRYGSVRPTPLWHHCFNGDLEAAREAIAAGADPSFGDDVSYSPLHVAVQEGRVAVIRLLLASGADANKTDNHGNGPLWTAVFSAPKDLRVEIITLLLEAGADPDHKNRYGHSPRDAANKIGHGLGGAVRRGSEARLTCATADAARHNGLWYNQCACSAGRAAELGR